MKEKKLNPVLVSVILIVLGILLIVWPDASVTIFVRLSAFALLAAAVIGIALQFFSKEEETKSKVLKILLFLLCGALGVWILINPILFEGFYQIVIGIIIAANALKDLVIAIRENKHWVFLALAILSLVFGVIVMCNPFTLFRTFAVISGSALIFSGIVSIINIIKSGKSKPEVQ